MDRNTIIGLTLIFILFIVWQQIMAPSQEELAEQQRLQDSIQLAQEQEVPEATKPDVTQETTTIPDTTSVEPDSLNDQRLADEFGVFALAASGKEEVVTLENDLFKIDFSSKGGVIREVTLKKHYKITLDENNEEVKQPLKLLEDEKNRFNYFLPIANLPSGGINTEDLYFTAEKPDANTVVLRADAGSGRYFEQRYSISPETYNIDYNIKLEGLNNILSGNTEAIQLTWVNYLDKLEINEKYERNYSSVYFKPVDDDPDYCSCTSSDIEEVTDRRVKWVSNVNQFFNSSLIAEEPFNGAILETKMLEEGAPDLKELVSKIDIPYGRGTSESYAMDLYVGPNEFDRLYDMGYALQDIIPFGRSIFGTINRWIVRPIFNFLHSFIGSAGIVILALTLFVKLLLYPLTFRMLRSQSKMSVLKPKLEGMKAKFKDEPQKQQMESMKIYREFGVNPLGGCMPMVLQMPIWIALYRFFPASIEFRQAGFLWANDLSSYDVIARLPFEIPLGFGSHISLFTLLWAITTLIYTHYNTKHMDMSANPAMKYMQYLMPLFFLGFFNSFAAGLTCYLLFSNLLNITQTIVTKNYIIDKDKLLAELEENKKKPKKKGGFQQRLEAAMKEQQKVQAEKEKQKKSKSKNRK